MTLGFQDHAIDQGHDYSKWSKDELNDEHDALELEIGDILGQISVDKQYGGRGSDWQHRASMAANYKKVEQKKIRRELNRRASDFRIKDLVAHYEDQIAKIKSKYVAKIAGVQKNANRQNEKSAAIIRWVRENEPHLLDEVYAAVTAAEQDFDRKEGGE